MRYEKILPQPRKPSDRAPRKLGFTWVRFADIARDFARLMPAAYAETGHHQALSPFDPNYETYLACDVAGIMRTLAVHHNGALVGFVLCMVGPHMDCASTRWGSISKIYLEPQWRRGGTGQKMLRLAHDLMRKEGVKLVTATDQMAYKNGRARSVAALLDFNGYQPVETVYVKVLE